MRVFASIAKSYENSGDVVHFEEGLTSQTVRELADAIAEVCGGIAAVFSGSDESGYSISRREVVLVGLCPDCQKANAN